MGMHLYNLTWITVMIMMFSSVDLTWLDPLGSGLTNSAGDL